MVVKEITDPEGSLLNILHKISPLTWRRYQQRYPEIWIKGHFEKLEKSINLPSISFRFENENEEIIKKLRNTINEYQGRVSWSLREHKRIGLKGSNWIIEPLNKLYLNNNPKYSYPDNYGHNSKIDQTFESLAYEDLESLKIYINSKFF